MIPKWNEKWLKIINKNETTKGVDMNFKDLKDCLQKSVRDQKKMQMEILSNCQCQDQLILLEIYTLCLLNLEVKIQNSF